MSSTAILALFLVLAACEACWDLLLTLLNMGHVRASAGVVPAFFRELWAARHADPPEPRYARGVEYTLARSRLSIVARVFSTALTLTLVLTGVLGHLQRLVAAHVSSPVLAGVVYVLALALGARLVSLPLGAWAQFRIERRFGFNTMGLGLWLADIAKGLALGALLLGPVCALLFLLIQRTGSTWWIPAAALVIVLQVVLTVIYPWLIAPLFNRFTPLADGSLKSRVLDLAAKLGFGVEGIYVMDASRRSRHTNAYFTGLGRAKRIVLYDTLLQRLGEEEALAVLAHEIGHDRLGHLWKGLAVESVATVAGLWILGLLMGITPLYQAFGVSAPAYGPALVIFTLCAGPCTFMLQPVASLWSRRHEYAADRYSHAAMGSSVPMVGALFKLAADNLSNLNPHPLYRFYHSTHPTLAERVAALEKLDHGR